MSSSVHRWAGRLASALAASISMFGGAQAGTVLSSQAPLGGGTAYQSSSDFQNAESFTLQNAASVTALRWWGTDIRANQFVVRLYDDLPSNGDTFATQTGLTGAALGKTSTNLAIDVGGFRYDIFEYELTLDTAFSAQANHQYYVSVFADVVDWGWLESAAGDNRSAFRAGDGSAWNFGAPDLSLAVVGDIVAADVPEPASLALTALALAAAGVAGRRRRVVALAT